MPPLSRHPSRSDSPLTPPPLQNGDFPPLTQSHLHNGDLPPLTLPHPRSGNFQLLSPPPLYSRNSLLALPPRAAELAPAITRPGTGFQTSTLTGSSPSTARYCPHRRACGCATCSKARHSPAPIACARWPAPPRAKPCSFRSSRAATGCSSRSASMACRRPGWRCWIRHRATRWPVMWPGSCAFWGCRRQCTFLFHSRSVTRTIVAFS